MIKKITIVFLLSLCITCALTAQSSRENASAQITMLKNGALLMKLKTSENIINGLISEGKTAEASKVKEEQAAKNLEIAKAFSEHIKFCKVFFFYSGNSNAIKNGDLGSIMNGDLKPDSTFNTINYLIGEFGESPVSNIEGFIIEDRNLQPLQSPFPFFTRSNKGGIKSRSYEEIAEALDEEFYAFYEEAKHLKR